MLLSMTVFTFESVFLQQLDRVPDQRFVAYGKQRLGTLLAQGKHARAPATRQDHWMELHRHDVTGA